MKDRWNLSKKITLIERKSVKCQCVSSPEGIITTVTTRKKVKTDQWLFLDQSENWSNKENCHSEIWRKRWIQRITFKVSLSIEKNTNRTTETENLMNYCQQNVDKLGREWFHGASFLEGNNVFMGLALGKTPVSHGKELHKNLHVSSKRRGNIKTK